MMRHRVFRNVVLWNLVLCSAALATFAAAQTPITLTFWDNQQSESGLSDYQKTAIDEFMAANPDIKVEVVTVPYTEYQQRLTLAVQGGNAPDVSTVDQIWNAGFAAANAILPLGEMIGNSSTVKEDAFFPGAWESATWNNEVWGVPFNVDVWQFSYYNKALLDRAGIEPQSLGTWDGLKAAGEALTDRNAGKFGVGLFTHKGEDSVVVMNSFVYSNGGSVLRDDGSCALADPEAVAALEFLKSLEPYAPEGILNASSGDMRELFLNASLATEWWPALEQPTLQKGNLDWGFVNGTAPEGKTAVGTFGGWNLVIYSQSKHQEAAWKFIEFLTSAKINGRVVDLLPANIQAADAFVTDQRSQPELILEHLNNARPRPLSPNYLEISDIEQDMLQAIFSGTAVAEAATNACQKIDALR